jgi:hypothetical protein
LSNSQIIVGVYYYPWYPLHWNYSKEYPKWNVVDSPRLGYYNCSNETVIRQQLTWMEESGIDFVILSWWGNGDWAYGYYGDIACQTIFQVIKQYKYNMTVALMVESFTGTTRDCQSTYNYVYDDYIVPYSNIYMKLDGLPLLCFYNSEITKNGTVEPDSQGRFQTRIIGHSSYVDWWFGIPCTVNNSTIPPLSKKDGMICVEPRYDDQFLNRYVDSKQVNSTFDANLSGTSTRSPLYDEQWNEVLRLARESKINYVMIYSWNEYHERSQIEPCNDRTSYITENSTLILNKTQYYISQINSLGKSWSLPSLPYIVIGLGTGFVAIIGYFAYKKTRKRK